MKRFRRQFWVGTVSLLAAAVFTLGLHLHFQPVLPDYPFLTGWVLLAAMLMLTFYNVWKKLPFLAAGRSEMWLQLHLYLGFFTVLLFLVHLNFHAPHGAFEIILASLFALVSVSGVCGLFFSRLLPRRLVTRGGEVIFEKIPMLRHSLRAAAEKLALEPATGSPVIGEFYVRRLTAFFSGPANFWHHLAESRRPLTALLAELTDLQRTGRDAERATLEELAALIRQKDGLDYHRALQLALKLWLFVHIPLTYGLLIFTALHLALVFGFSGGVR